MPGRLIYLMGPSGAGKDSLIEAAHGTLQQLNVRVARRVITRSAESVGEDAVGVSPEQFRQMCEQGAFAMSWQANGLEYGIPAQIDAWLDEGHHVLVNGSRAYLERAAERYSTLLAVLLVVDPAVLRQRLIARGRESIGDIERRLARSQRFDMQVEAVQAGSVRIHLLDNSGSLPHAVVRLMALLAAEGISAIPD
ncbi:Ribose 1,5-bisphosphate phosphokinase PhnN [compost metagenome]